MTSFTFSHLCKEFISKYSHILRRRELGYQYKNFRKHNSAHKQKTDIPLDIYSVGKQESPPK